jgi:hypothetical protein
LVLASYRWIVTSTLFVGFLAGTSTSARATGIHERIPMRMREATMVLAGDLSREHPSFSREKSYGSAEFVLGFSEDSVFDIFCSATDTRWLEPDENDSTPNLQRIRAAGSKPITAARRRYRLRPC